MHFKHAHYSKQTLTAVIEIIRRTRG